MVSQSDKGIDISLEISARMESIDSHVNMGMQKINSTEPGTYVLASLHLEWSHNTI